MSISSNQIGGVGADTLKDALAKLGLKCGGTLRQRAERLILTKTKSLEELDRKLFAKGVVPAVRVKLMLELYAVISCTCPSAGGSLRKGLQLLTNLANV